MTDNVIILPVITTLDIPADRILESAIGKLTHAIVIGYDHEGDEYFASSYGGGPDTLWLMERMKLALLRIGDDD